MSDSANTFDSLKPLFKEGYSDKLKKLSDKPQSSKQYYAHLKKYIKKANKR